MEAILECLRWYWTWLGDAKGLQVPLVTGLFIVAGWYTKELLLHWLKRPKLKLKIVQGLPTEKNHEVHDLLIINTGSAPSYVSHVTFRDVISDTSDPEHSFTFTLKDREREVLPKGKPARIPLPNTSSPDFYNGTWWLSITSEPPCTTEIEVPYNLFSKRAS